MWPVALPGSWVASTKRWKDAGSADSPTIGATEDAPARRVIAGQGPGERCRLHHELVFETFQFVVLTILYVRPSFCFTRSFVPFRESV